MCYDHEDTTYTLQQCVGIRFTAGRLSTRKSHCIGEMKNNRSFSPSRFNYTDSGLDGKTAKLQNFIM